MGAASVNSGDFQERRHSSMSQVALWNCLSIPQKLGANNLSKFGYELAFVRKEMEDKTAIMLNGSSVALVNDSGEIDTNPEIVVR